MLDKDSEVCYSKLMNKDKQEHKEVLEEFDREYDNYIDHLWEEYVKEQEELERKKRENLEWLKR